LEAPEILRKYFKLTEAQTKQFCALDDLYRDWNNKINVISRKDIDNLYERHVLHSLSIAKVLQFNAGTHILDIGTGGGFPGIPLAILFPDCQFHLIDSIGKKIKVVDEIIFSLGLNNCYATHVRAEHVKGHYDFAVSRAVTEIPIIAKWVKNKIQSKSTHHLPNGLLCLKGEDVENELKGLRYPHRVFPLSKYFQEEFFQTKVVVHLEMDF